MTSTPLDPSRRSTIRSSGWRTVDIVVASVIAVTFGVVFALWNNFLYPTLSAPLTGSPVAPLLAGIWLVPGVVGGLVLRRPGAAFYTETVAATVSLLFGSVWGLSVVMSGVVQGVAPELVFAATRYRRWGLAIAILAGAAAGAAMGVYECIVYVPTYSAGAKLVYVLCGIAAGAVVAGFLGWLLVRSLARTGALAPFPSGRDQDHADRDHAGRDHADRDHADRDHAGQDGNA